MNNTAHSKTKHLVTSIVLLSCALSSAARAQPAELLVLEWRIQTTATSIEIFGRVKNVSSRQFDSLYVKAAVYSGKIKMKGGPVLIARPNLPSGEESDYRCSIPRKTIREFSVVEELKLSNATLNFVNPQGHDFLLKLPKWTTTRNTSNQLDSIEAKTGAVIQERRKAKEAAAAKSRRELPDWWIRYGKATAQLRAAELTLRAAYRAEGRADTVRREVLALKKPLVQAAQSLTQAPDQRVQADVQRMFIKLASAIEKHDQGALFGFQTDYAEAVKLIQQIEGQRRASKEQ